MTFSIPLLHQVVINENSSAQFHRLENIPTNPQPFLGLQGHLCRRYSFPWEKEGGFCELLSPTPNILTDCNFFLMKNL